MSSRLPFAHWDNWAHPRLFNISRRLPLAHNTEYVAANYRAVVRLGYTTADLECFGTIKFRIWLMRERAGKPCVKPREILWQVSTGQFQARWSKSLSFGDITPSGNIILTKRYIHQINNDTPIKIVRWCINATYGHNRRCSFFSDVHVPLWLYITSLEHESRNNNLTSMVKVYSWQWYLSSTFVHKGKTVKILGNNFLFWYLYR